jgi:RNA polymerase sigma-70 factor (ECF subfamily)
VTRSYNGNDVSVQFGAEQVQRLLSGDPEAGREFAARFVPLLRVKIRCRRPGAPEAVVADLVQETLVRVLASLKAGRVQEPGRLGAFVSGVCDHVLLEGRTRAGRLVPLDDVPEPARTLGNTETLAALHQRARLAEQVMASLPAREQEVLRLILVEDRDREEVCERYGITRENLRVILCRARDRLRALCEEEPPRNVKKRA